MEQTVSEVSNSQQVLYKNMDELVKEWQKSEKDCSLWEYLGIPELVFKQWIIKCKKGIFDN